MASGSGETIIVPRNFVLLAELEKAEKGNTDMSVSYGLTEKDDVTLSTWQCTILGQMGSVVDSRIISLIVHCGPQYPVEPPTIQFQSKVNFPFVDGTGKVLPNKLPGTILSNWTRREDGIEKVLQTLRQAMANKEHKGRQQPPEGETY